MQATINAVKPTGGVKANAFLIFDYVSATDFKFAGIDVSTNKLEIGHRTAAGWIVDNWTNFQAKAGIDYVVMLAVDGSTATLTTGKTSVSFTFGVRTDAEGIVHTLNYGLTGIGANGATAQIDNVVVQAPPGATTLDKTADFSAASPASQLFNTPVMTGSWVTTADGRFQGTAATATAPAVDLIGFPVTAGSTLTILTTVKTFGQGGVVFDYQGPNAFKFVTLSADGKQIVIGHQIGASLVIDATFNTTIKSGTDYQLGVTLKGSLVNVSLNGAVVLSTIYNETITQGGYGLISFKGATSGVTSFDIVEVKTDDATYGAALQLAAEAAPALPNGVTLLNVSQLNMIVDEAKQIWTTALGVNDARLATLAGIDVQLGDLPGLLLGETIGDTIIIDADAAGWGWFVDATPLANSEFPLILAKGVFAANPGSPAYGHMDLLSTVLHELGNAMGFAEDAGQDVTGATLQAGLRRLPSGADTTNGVSTVAAADAPSSTTVLAEAVAPTLANTVNKPAASGVVPGLVVAATAPPAGPVAIPYPNLAAATNATFDAPFGGNLGGSFVNLDQLAGVVAAAPPAGPVSSAHPNGAAVTATVGAPFGANLGGSFVGLDLLAGPATGIGKDLLGTGTTLPPDGDEAAAKGHHGSSAKPAGTTDAGEAAVIAWYSDGASVLGGDGGRSGGSQDWLDDFLNHLGQNESLWNPNAGIRVRPTPPVAAA